jgi:histidyl-tRNA synthetase
MHDILPEDAVRWRWLEERFRDVVGRYGFGEVRTPLLEATALFVREIGEGTDVVEKEMYSFTRHEDSLTVRPEGTAGAARAYVQHGVSGKEPISRWYYLGPMFRAERPAKGRYRQFHQGGCEIYGDPGPVCDAELIAMCDELLGELGIAGRTVHINSLGSGDTRERYRAALTSYFEPHAEKLSEESRRRLHANPLRILDSKAPVDRELSVGAPHVLDILDDADRAHFDGLRRCLDALKVEYRVDPTLVRGLDYYTRTLFELKTTSTELGSQDTLIGGGRYDKMVKSLGNGKDVPAIGFAMGIERILALSTPPVGAEVPAVYIAPLSQAAAAPALVLAQRLRKAGLRCEVDGRGQSVKSMLRRANTLQSRLCVILGEDELARGKAKVKDLADGTHQEVGLDDVNVAELLRTMAASGVPSPAGSADNG